MLEFMFKSICKKTQSQLKEWLPSQLKEAGYTDVIKGDGFIYARGELPILLTAHMDTVHKETVKKIVTTISKDSRIISSPEGIGGDDRCGIFMILEIIKEMKPYVLFCEDEEVGGVGSRKFCKTEYIKELESMKYLVELDRANAKDAVFYDCDNPEFTKFITETTGYKEDYGSFSDISELSPVCGVASVNLSCGYYNAHTLKEYVVWNEMVNTINVVKKLLATECERFEYIEAVRYYGKWGKYLDDYSYGYGYYNYGYSYGGKEKVADDLADDEYVVYVTYLDYDGNDVLGEGRGHSKTAAFGDFFINNPDVCYSMVLDYEFDTI